MTVTVASTSSAWKPSTTWTRWFRRLGAVVLVLLFGMLIASSLNLWAQALPNWGLHMATEGPQTYCIKYPRCFNYWNIQREDVGSLSYSLIPPDAQICGYINHNGQRVPLQRAYTTSQQVNSAAAIILLAPDHSCDPASAITTGQVSPLTALVDIGIALVGATLAALLFLNASQRPQAIHTIAFLGSFVLIFAWLPLRAVATTQVIMAGTAVLYFLTPPLLVTLLWHLLMVPKNRWQFLARAVFFAAILGVGLILALILAMATTTGNSLLYHNSLTLGNLFLYSNAALAVAIVLSSNFIRPSRTQRDYARILGVGTLIALAPWVLFNVLPAQYLVFDTSTAAISLVAFPLALAYVVLKRDLLRADAVMRRSTEQGVRIILIAFVSVLLLSLAVEVFGLPVAAAAAAFAVMLGIGILSPLLQMGAEIVTEAGLFPEMWRYRRLLKRASIRPGTAEPQQIVTELISEIRLALPVRDIVCLARNEDDGLFEPIGDGFGNHSPALNLPLEDPLAARLQQRGQPLIRADIPEAAETEPGDEPPYGVWECFVPIMLEDRLLGIVTLGPREDGMGYSSADRRLLLQLANRRAVSLDYGRVLAALRVAYEEQKYVDELKDQFIMTAHHELRTPLTTMLGYVEIVEKSGVPAWQEAPDEMLNMMREALRAGDDMTNLLDTLLTADRNMLKQQLSTPKQVDISLTLNRIVQDIQVGTAGSGRRITLSCPGGLQGFVDKDAFVQIMTNLLTNALKYSPDDAPVEVRAQVAEHPSLFQVSVRDYGAGIPPKDQAAIFERFVRLERDLNSPVRGTGLGLAIVKERINGMGGAIWVESSGVAGEGSTFFVTLPTGTPLARSRPLPAPKPVAALSGTIATAPRVPTSAVSRQPGTKGTNSRQIVRYGPKDGEGR